MLPAKLLLATAALALPLCVSANAQVFDVSAGVSTLYGAEGAAVVIHGDGRETTIGAGLINGHVGIGAASTSRLRGGGSVTAGQQQFSMELPTDIFGGGQILSGTGIGFSSAPAPGRGLRAFAGVSSAESGSPLFQSTRLNSAAGYLQFKQPISDTLTFLSTALLSTRTGGAFLESLSWAHSPKVHYAVTAGVGSGDPYGAVSYLFKGRTLNFQSSYVLAADRFQRGTDPELAISEPIHENVSGEYRVTRSITLSGMRRNFLTPTTTKETPAEGTQSTLAIRSSLDEGGIEYHRSSTVLNFTYLHSRSMQQSSQPTAPEGSSGISVGFTHKLGKADWSEHFYESYQGDHQHTALLVSGLAVNLNPRLRLTESMNLTANGPNFSHGGAFLTSFSSFEVDYQLLYLATRPDRPFEQAMVFDSRIRIVRDLWLQAASSVGSTGSILYTFRIGKQFTHNAAGTAPVPAASFGSNVIRGRVVDQHGVAVEGAAILIDSTYVYTDSKGFFFFRETNSRIHPLKVSTEDFMQVGAFGVLSAPQFAHSSTEQDFKPITIVVNRIAPDPAENNRRPITAPRKESNP